MLRRDIESFLLQKQGYLKKAPIKVAQALWKTSSKHNQRISKEQLLRELAQIKEIQRDLRTAKDIKNSVEEDLLMATYEKILAEKDKPKRRLFFDIEVSPNIVFSWRVGQDQSIPHESLIQERAIICIGYKWEGDKEVSYLVWDKGNDGNMMKKFATIIDSADELVTQNGDRYDIRWVRTRCMYHGIPVSSKFNSIDTLKMARAQFSLNSNKLDYMGQFLKEGKKIKTDYDLWRDIVLHNDKKALTKMVDYCKEDVNLLERVYNRLQEYSPIKKFKYKV